MGDEAAYADGYYDALSAMANAASLSMMFWFARMVWLTARDECGGTSYRKASQLVFSFLVCLIASGLIAASFAVLGRR